ncbi:MAG TPA: hypothetical protein VGX24_05200 [Pyrinomonadaceae bacterium]|jgi:hypothetical protein|nr:hypothetical protein [Pyrinomonadaceae bacterium]
MNYLICFGIVVTAGCVLTFVSNGFAYAMSRMLEAGFEFVEYRLALRAHERRSMKRDAQLASASATTFRAGEIVALPVNRRSTQQLGVARVAA